MESVLNSINGLFHILDQHYMEIKLRKMLKIVLLFVCAGFCVCDQLPSNWAPYPPSPGYTGVYGAPPLPTTTVEISKENLEYAGKLVEIKPTSAPQVCFEFNKLLKLFHHD